jgi:hypothetical protein
MVGEDGINRLSTLISDLGLATELGPRLTEQNYIEASIRLGDYMDNYVGPQ